MLSPKPIKIALVAFTLLAVIAFLIGPKPDESATTSSAVLEASQATTVEVIDPVHGRPFQVSTWAPAREENNKLVVISHGFAGDRTSHDYIATRLSAEGFTVAAPTHPDLAGLQSNDPQLDPLVLRPRHLSLTIDQMTEATAKPFEEVIVVGHSFGGYSALRLAGAHPSSDGVAQHCDSNPGDDVLCTPAARSRFDRLIDSGVDFTDSRVNTIILMAPGYGPLFSADADLPAVEAEVLIVAADDDRLLPGQQVNELLDAMPGGTKSVTVAGGHYIFLRTCTAVEQDAIADLCTDPVDVNRESVHNEILNEIADFIE